MVAEHLAAPVRVVHLIPDLDTGGAEIMLARLVTALDRSRIDSVVISMTDVGPVGRRIAEAGTMVLSLGMRRKALNLLALPKIVAALRQLKPDVLQTWLYHADVAGMVAAKWAGIPHVAWNIRCTDIDLRDYSSVLRLVIRTAAWISHWPSVIVSNSEAGRTAHERIGYAADRWTIIPNGIDVDRFRPSASARSNVRQALGLMNDARLVGMLARFHPMKDHETFLRAAAKVAKRREDVQFVLAGRGVGSNVVLAGLIEELGLHDRIHLFDERHDVPDLLAALDVAVMSSSMSEGFPTVIAEAMACGTPCVATDVGDAALIVGDSGIVVPPRQPDVLAAGISKLLDLDGAANRSLRVSVRNAIVQRFGIVDIANRYTQLWLDLARGVSPGSSICAE